MQRCGDFGGKNVDGRPCGKPAGWGTDRLDSEGHKTGKCRRCCRWGGGRPVTTPNGIMAAIEREAKREGSLTYHSVKQRQSEPDLLDLNFYAALCREIGERAIFALDSDVLNDDTYTLALSAADAARKVTESIAKVNLMRQELLSKKQTEATYSVLESIFALCLDNPDLPVSAILDQLRERLFNFRAVAQLPEPAIEAEIVTDSTD